MVRGTDERSENHVLAADPKQRSSKDVARDCESCEARNEPSGFFLELVSSY